MSPNDIQDFKVRVPQAEASSALPQQVIKEGVPYPFLSVDPYAPHVHAPSGAHMPQDLGSSAFAGPASTEDADDDDAMSLSASVASPVSTTGYGVMESTQSRLPNWGLGKGRDGLNRNPRAIASERKAANARKEKFSELEVALDEIEPGIAQKSQAKKFALATRVVRAFR
jgi:hypothetical protein